MLANMLGSIAEATGRQTDVLSPDKGPQRSSPHSSPRHLDTVARRTDFFPVLSGDKGETCQYQNHVKNS